jgi:hypothetical protein
MGLAKDTARGIARHWVDISSLLWLALCGTTIVAALIYNWWRTT